MGLFQRSSREPASEQRTIDPHAQSQGDPLLPGVCGYLGTGPMAKNAMPNTRLSYVRPDGNPRTPDKLPGLGVFRDR